MAPENQHDARIILMSTEWDEPMSLAELLSLMPEPYTGDALAEIRALAVGTTWATGFDVPLTRVEEGDGDIEIEHDVSPEFSETFPDGIVVSLAQMIADNAECPWDDGEDYAAIRALPIGGECTIGPGGACGTTLVRRVA